MLKEHPCKIVEIHHSKPGKHGHAKAHVVGLDIFTGKKYEDIFPTSHSIEVPVVVRSEYQVVSIGFSGSISVLLPTGELKIDLNMPTAAAAGASTDEDCRLERCIKQAY